MGAPLHLLYHQSRQCKSIKRYIREHSVGVVIMFRILKFNFACAHPALPLPCLVAVVAVARSKSFFRISGNVSNTQVAITNFEDGDKA